MTESETHAAALLRSLGGDPLRVLLRAVGSTPLPGSCPAFPVQPVEPAVEPAKPPPAKRLGFQATDWGGLPGERGIQTRLRALGDTVYRARACGQVSKTYESLAEAVAWRDNIEGAPERAQDELQQAEADFNDLIEEHTS